MRIGSRLLALTLPLVMCSCAALRGRGPFFVPIDSTPRGATVSQGIYKLGTTPCRVHLTPRDTVVQVSLDGYAERTVDVGTVSNIGLIFMGFIFWGPIELVTAAMADAEKGVDTRPVHVSMSKEARPRWHRESPQ
jgi:hypothetical protein